MIDETCLLVLLELVLRKEDLNWGERGQKENVFLADESRSCVGSGFVCCTYYTSSKCPMSCALERLMNLCNIHFSYVFGICNPGKDWELGSLVVLWA